MRDSQALMPYLCADCATDHVLSSLALPGPSSHLCLLCGSSARRSIDLDVRHSREVLRALLRYHFDEWHYNRHLGGDHIETLLRCDNPIFRHSNADAVS